MNGILLLNKPEGVTSYKSIEQIKKHFKIKKIGHAGTIDSFASGLLIVGINEGTKLLPYFIERTKEYITTFHLGINTDTFDITGNITYEYNGELPELSYIEAKIKNFIGAIYQVPPVYSAVKIGGVRASDIVRDGKSVELSPRKVFINDIEIIEYKKPFLKLKIACGKGTYIRSIARDLGVLLKCGAYVKSLVRTKIDPFSIEKSHELKKLLNTDSIHPYVLKLQDALPFMKKISLSYEDFNAVTHGKPILVTTVLDNSHYLGIYKNKATSVLSIDHNKGRVHLKPERILFDE